MAKPVNIPITYKSDPRGLNKGAGALSKFAAVGAAAAAAVVAAFAGAAAASVRMASEFEDSFAKIEGLVGVAKDQLGELSDAALELGPKFGKSAGEAADALFFITSAGLRGADAVTVLEASLKGAAIGLGDTKTIADLATSAVNAYGASQLDGAQAVDVLTEAVREGKLEPAELASAMGQVLPLASALGVQFDEVGAAMAAMSRTGTDASTAATQLRQIMASLTKPTADAEKALGEMGMSSAGLREQIKDEGLLSVLESLTGAFDGNVEATASVFGNIRALSGVLDLMGPAADDTRAIFGRMTDGVGVLDEAFKATEETLSFQFNQSMEEAKTAVLELGTSLLPVAKEIVDGFGPVIEVLGPVLQDAFENLGPAVGEFAQAFADTLVVASPLFAVLGDLLAVLFEMAADLLPVLNPLIEALISIFEVVVEAVAPFLVQLIDMLAPILGDIAELVKVLVEAILPVFVSLFEALAPVVLQVVEALLPLLEILLPGLTMWIESFVAPALQFFAEMLGTLITALGQLTAAGLLPSLESFGLFEGGIRTSMRNVRQIVADTMNGMIDFLEKGVNEMIASINSLLERARTLPGLAGSIARKINNLPPIELKRIEVPGLFDDMTFSAVDTTGLRDVADRFLEFKPGESSTDEANRRVNALRSNQAFNQEQAARTLAERFGMPKLAEGGIVRSPIVGMIGEAGPEAVIPLNKAGSLGSTINITVNAGMGTNGSRVGEEIVSAIKKYERSSGPVFARA